MRIKNWNTNATGASGDKLTRLISVMLTASLSRLALEPSDPINTEPTYLNINKQTKVFRNLLRLKDWSIDAVSASGEQLAGLVGIMLTAS